MHKLEFIAQLAIAHRLTTGKELAVLLDSSWDVKAIGRHAQLGGKTAHTAIINVLQNHPVEKTFTCLSTYEPAAMCKGMAHNLGVTLLQVDGELEQGDELEVRKLPDAAKEPEGFLKKARRLKGVAGLLFTQFETAPSSEARLTLSAALARVLSRLPDPAPFRGAAGDVTDMFMLSVFSLVGLSWTDPKRMHAQNLTRGERLCGNNVGAIIVKDNTIIAWGLNSGAEHLTFHAETVAIQSYLARTGKTSLPADCVLYTTLQPCKMCAGLILQTCPGASVVYGLRDGWLRTGLTDSGKEQRWAHDLSDKLDQKISDKRDEEEEQHSSIHYLRGDVSSIFLNAFEHLLQCDRKSQGRKDLFMHCLELLLNATQAGMATGYGIDIILEMFNARDAIKQNSGERVTAHQMQLEHERTEQLLQLVQEQCAITMEGAKKAKEHLQKAEPFDKKVQEELRLILKEKKTAEAAAERAGKHRTEAEQQEKSREAREKAELANGQIQLADKAYDAASSALKRLKEQKKKAKGHATEAIFHARTAMKAAETASEAENQLKEKVPKVAVALNKAKEAEASTQAAEQCLTKIKEARNDAVTALTATSEAASRTQLQTELAFLAASRKGQLANINGTVEKALKNAELAKKAATLARELEEQAAFLVQQAESAVANCKSSIAKAIGEGELVKARQNAEKAQQNARKMEEEYETVSKQAALMLTSLEKAGEASDQNQLAELINLVKERANGVMRAAENTQHYKELVDSALELLKSNGQLAENPVSCVQCTTPLEEETTDSARWHYCASCDHYYCDACGYKRPYSGILSRTRKCHSCNGTTQLV
ncbi:deaminase [Archangium violaceum]|uniref:Bd3614 family nucleic acid deaminase n=1 Tax=Archangium violaceum TaxID=83451 RepID=UPI002B2CD1C2|nr:deaminase [Archangium gephyra]